jgi:pimeloyl-ACP methyl ester carboxylesterase
MNLLSTLLMLMMSWMTTPSSEKTESRTITFRGAKLHALVAGPENGPAILLLHGMRFHSGTWLEIGTYRYLADRGFRVVGLDIPGFGRSEKADVSVESFLSEVLPLLEIKTPVVVSPSMSGGYTFPFVLRFPEAASGFVPVGAAGIGQYESQLENIKVPTLVVWGDKDSISPLQQGELLHQKVAGSKMVVLRDARHPCYLDRPEEFHQALLDFLNEIGEK